MRASALVLLAAAVVLPACRDIELATEIPQFEWGEPPRRLTFNVGDDRNPQWSANGDSVYYSAQGYPGLPLAPGVLVAASVTGGTVRPLYRSLHETVVGPRYHVAPVVSPDGQRMLFIDIAAVDAPAECIATTTGEPCPGAEPLLRRVHLTVRDLAETGTVTQHILVVDMPGRAERGLPEPYTDHSYPYHQLYQDGRIAFTASWSPDGERIVFSNGLQLFLWTPGDAEAQPIPGTDHGMRPAWSPDGARIAFMTLRPHSTTANLCACSQDGSSSDVIRHVYVAGDATLELIAPDGTANTIIAQGEDPAWGPDGSLYARVTGRIARIDPQTGTATPIPGTDGGAEPAVSPDGAHLAFIHLPDAGGSDVWVVDLDGQ
jgi:Tol biopolymer transport system component